MPTEEKLAIIETARTDLRRVLATMESALGASVAFQCTRYIAEADREAGMLHREIKRLKL